GLDGDLDTNIRDTMFYTKSLRNLYAHQAGRADARFIEDCPNFNAVAGAQVQITRAQLAAAYTAMVLYVETVVDRIRASLDLEGRRFSLPPWIDSTDQLRTMILPARALGAAGASESIHVADA